MIGLIKSVEDGTNGKKILKIEEEFTVNDLKKLYFKLTQEKNMLTNRLNIINNQLSSLDDYKFTDDGKLNEEE